MDSQVDVCETAFFLFQKVGGWTKKTLASKAMKTIGYSKVIHSAPKLVLGCPSRR